MDHCDVYDGTMEAISMLDPLDLEEAYRYIPSSHDSLQ